MKLPLWEKHVWSFQTSSQIVEIDLLSYSDSVRITVWIQENILQREE